MDVVSQILPGVNTGTTNSPCEIQSNFTCKIISQGKAIDFYSGLCPVATAIPMGRSTIRATTATGGHRPRTMLPMPGTGT